LEEEVSGTPVGKGGFLLVEGDFGVSLREQVEKGLWLRLSKMDGFIAVIAKSRKQV
jgi:hypothetical protein